MTVNAAIQAPARRALPRAGALVVVVVAGAPRRHEGRLAAVRRACVADAFASVCRAKGAAVNVIDDRHECDDEVRRWVQSAFISLVDAGIAQWRDAERRWCLEAGAYDDENDRRVEELRGWKPAAIAAQRELLGRTDGVEVDAVTLEGTTTLSVFTPHVDAVTDAAFVAVSPSCPAVEHLVRDLPDGEDGVAETETAVVVPGLARPVPLVISVHVQKRYGPTAVLGVPSASTADARIAERLAPMNAGGWRIAGKRADPRPATRFRPREIVLSDPAADGPLVFVLRCRTCGPVPPGDSDTCPECGEEVDRDPQRIAFGAPGVWSALRDGAPTLSVRAAGDDLDILGERTIAKALRDALDTSEPTDGEPHGPTVMVGDVTGEPPRAVAEQAPDDALRFGLLFAAAPAKEIRWGDDVIQHGARFLDRLCRYAMPRLALASAAADRNSDAEVPREHRPLAKWTRVATERVTENLASADMQRATRNVIMLLDRIEDFERRIAEERGGDLEDVDCEAIAGALMTLAQLLSPLAPATAQHLWERGGMPGSVEGHWPLGA